jgi:hypothetical protein
LYQCRLDTSRWEPPRHVTPSHRTTPFNVSKLGQSTAPLHAGKRKGVGMYFFREGGMYVGNYAKGLRSGLGIHVTKVRPNLDT